MKWMVIILILITTVSCRTKQNTVSIIKHRDSVIVVEKTIIDTMYIPSSNASATIPITLIKDTTIINHSKGQATAKLTIKDGKINCEAYCDSLWKIYEKNTTTSYQQLINSEQQNKNVINKTCNKWFWLALGAITSFVGLLVLSLIIFKIY